MTAEKPKKKNIFRNILILISLGLLIAGAIGYDKYNEIFSKNVPDQLADKFIHIPSESNFDDVVNLLLEKKMIIDTSSFSWLSDRMNYKREIMRAGYYEITPGWSNHSLIKHLRGGKQTPINLVISSGRLPKDVAEKAAKFIEADEASILSLITDPNYLEKHNLTKETVMTTFIPNTYQFFWNKNAKQFFERMIKENKTFWSKNRRLEKAEALNLSPIEVYTLASIIERETNQKDERKRVAGVYLNRLRKNIMLQADPTVVFAFGDFSLRRVLNKHLEIDSPYNTYKYTGLPPGPISLASISSIDAVLDAEDHDYIFFCAKGDGSGYHSFAKTLAGHNNNAKIYKRNLKKRGRR